MNYRNAIVGSAALTLLAALTTGCEKKTCRAGEQVACECPGGGAGAQRCNRAGTQFEECDCSVPPATASPIASSVARLEASEERIQSSLAGLEERIGRIERGATVSASSPGGPTSLPSGLTMDGYVDAYCACKNDVKCLSDATLKYQEVLVKTTMTSEQMKRIADCASAR